MAGGRVVAATGSGLRVFDAATGTSAGASRWPPSAPRRWRFGTIAYGSPAVSGGRVYVSGVRSVNGQDAAVVDQFRLGPTAAG